MRKEEPAPAGFFFRASKGDTHDGNISATARAPSMHRRTLQRKLHKRPAKR